MVLARRRSIGAALACSLLLVTLVVVIGQRPAAAAPVTSVKGEACAYFVKVGLFAGPQDVNGCNEGINSDNSGPARPPAAGTNTTDRSYSPHVRIGGSGGSMSASDANGAAAIYGPATIHGGRWPCEEDGGRNCPATAPPSGPQAASTTGSAASGTVTATADISLHPSPVPVGCYPGYGPSCSSLGGFGPWPSEGASLHAECTATDTSVTGSATFEDAWLAISTDGEGEPVIKEPVPDNPPPNYTRHGVITNVGDVFSIVFNEQIKNADGSLTVNAVHMYLMGPVAVGELVRGQVTCGTTPSTLPSTDTVAPSCGHPVVKPMGPEDPTPQVPRSELVGTFDAGRGGNTGIQSVTNVQVINGTVTIGDPSSSFSYLRFSPGQTGPLPITATRTVESLPMYWSFTITDTAGNSSVCHGVEAVPPSSPVGFHPLTPGRILDSRSGAPWGPGASRDVLVAGGTTGVPAGAVAVVLNATVTETTAAGFLTIWPAGQQRPLASSLNWAAGQTIPNAVTVKVGAGGNVSVFNAVGNAHVIFDVVGYYDSVGGAGFTPLTPARILDSRSGAPWGAGQTRNVTVTGGTSGVPAGADAVVLNVTVTGTTGPGYLTIWPAGQPQPLASSLNWAPGQTIPNAVTVKVGAGGNVSVFNAVGNAHVIVDVVGSFALGSGSLFHPLPAPARIQDSRTGVARYASPWGPSTSRDVEVGSLVSPTATAALLNVTATGTTGASYLTIWPDGQLEPLASSLNWAPGVTIANAVTTKVGTGGEIRIKNAVGNVHVIADMAGWYGP